MCGLFCNAFDGLRADFDFRSVDSILGKRGPDSSGVFEVDFARVRHFRLAIVGGDSGFGSQPILSSCGRFVLSFNGEIFNFTELAHQFFPKLLFKSDTELLLKLFEHLGDRCFGLLRGMFAIVIIDIAERCVVAARDEFGIKPLFAQTGNSGLILCSQLTAIIAACRVGLTLSEDGVDRFHLLGSLPTENTIIEGIWNVEPGFVYRFKQVNGHVSYNKTVFVNASRISDQRLENFVKQTHMVLSDSVLAHSVGDSKKVAIMLSGGLDSSLLAQLLCEQGSVEVIAITIDYHDSEFSGPRGEASTAARIASDLGIPHHIVYLNKDKFADDMDSIFTDMDQPSVDGINVWYAAREAKKLGIKVMFSGVGADELFFGYSQYVTIDKYRRIINLMVRFSWFRSIINLVFYILGLVRQKSKLLFASLFTCDLFSVWVWNRSVGEFERFPGGKDSLIRVIAGLRESFLESKSANDSSTFAALDWSLYMRNQLLRDSDWATMAHGVELRVPFVDKKVYKWALEHRQVLQLKKKKEIFLPLFRPKLREILANKPKRGFYIPFDRWMRSLSNSDCNETKTGLVLKLWQSKHLSEECKI